MFKQSHVILSGYLADRMQTEEVRQHRSSLGFGSVQPDLSPKLRAKSHEFSATWEDTKALIRTINASCVTDLHSERTVCRQMGMVLHYLADYFTCPHNPSYDINFTEHCLYEGRLAYLLRAYLHSSKAQEQFLFQKAFAEQLHSVEELIAHIEKMHSLYLQESEHTPGSDCRWIMGICACAAIVLESKVYGKQEEWLYGSSVA